MPTYRRNYLNKVIFRIDFEEVKIIKLDALIGEMSSILPLKSEKKGVEGTLRFAFTGGESQQVVKDITVFQLANQENNKRLEFSSKWALLEYDKGVYVNSSKLIEDIQATVDKIIATLSINLLHKVGLRYVNKILLSEASPLSWDKYIKPTLTGGLGFAIANSMSISRSMGQIIEKGDNSEVVMNYGIWNQDFPNEITKKEYILDFDCKSRLPIDVADSMPSDVAKEFNAKIERLFEASITEGFRKLLNKR